MSLVGGSVHYSTYKHLNNAASNRFYVFAASDRCRSRCTTLFLFQRNIRVLLSSDKVRQHTFQNRRAVSSRRKDLLSMIGWHNIRSQDIRRQEVDLDHLSRIMGKAVASVKPPAACTTSLPIFGQSSCWLIAQEKSFFCSSYGFLLTKK